MTRRTLTTAITAAFLTGAAAGPAQAHDVLDVNAGCDGASVLLGSFPDDQASDVLVTVDSPDGDELASITAPITSRGVIFVPYDASGLERVIVTAEWLADGGRVVEVARTLNCPGTPTPPIPAEPEGPPEEEDSFESPVSSVAPPVATPVPPAATPPVTTRPVRRKPVTQRRRSTSRVPRCVPATGRVRLDGPKVAPRAPGSLNRYVVRGAHLKSARFYIDGQLRKVDRSGPLSFTVRSDRLGRKGRPLYGRHVVRVVVTRESCGKTTRHVASMRVWNLDAPGDVRIASLPPAGAR